MIAIVLKLVSQYHAQESILENFVIVDLPGIKKENVDITVEDQNLTITGVRSVETDERLWTTHRTELRHGKVYRTFLLPDDVDKEKISATFDHGVMKLCMQKLGQSTN